MSKVNWDEAPVWATAYGQNTRGSKLWLNDRQYKYLHDDCIYPIKHDQSSALTLTLSEIKVEVHRCASSVPTQLQEAYNNLINKFKEDTLEIVDAHVSKLHTDFAPYLEQDNQGNISNIANNLVNKLVRGDFERHNVSSVVVKDDNGVGTRIHLTSHQYDNLRKNLIEAMPKCPKDLEIESLKQRLRHAYERNY